MVITSKLRIQAASHTYRRSRAHVLYCALVSGYDNVHIRANVFRMQTAMQYGHSAGDR